MRIRVPTAMCAVLALLLLTLVAPADVAAQGGGHKSFAVSIYTRVYEVRQMADTNALRATWDVMNRDLHVEKIYLETHRDTLLADEKTIAGAKKFFTDRGIRVAGGITLTRNESNRFETFCYSDPKDRAWVKHIVEYTARQFDEIILDDFFFTSCKSPIEIRAKGNKSWTEYRLALLTEVAKDLIVGPAKRVNPKVRVIVKYPNWYEHFQGLGFNLETEPAIFDGVYTGTETRDAVLSAQHLQPYLGYNVFRYFESLKPQHNGGGWVDPGGMRTLDRYAEQLWVTGFAKAPEITLFDFRQLRRRILASDRGEWQGQGTSFDFEKTVAPYRNADGSFKPELTIARAAGLAFTQLDSVVGKLGTPIGIRAYRPFHSTGEDFLHNFLGMIGIPIAMGPTFPADAQTILLTETAKFDTNIVSKIKGQLMAGKSVVITTGLLHALQNRGIRDIAELDVGEKRALVDEYTGGRFGGTLIKGRKPILIPQLHYLTNDSWELVSAVDGANGWPLLHDADYGRGHLYVLTIPDNPADLYDIPPEILTRIKQVVMKDFPIRVDGPSQVALYAYDNDTFVVESFLDSATTVSVVSSGAKRSAHDLLSGEAVNGSGIGGQSGAAVGGPGRRGPDDGKTSFSVKLPAHSYRAFRLE